MTPEKQNDLPPTSDPALASASGSESSKDSAPMLCIWKPAFIVASISALPVMLLKDRWPWIIAVPIIGGTCWILWREMHRDNES